VKKPAALSYLDMGAIPPGPDEKYRYVLWRQLREGTKTLLWIALNPSKASATTEDPTLGRFVSFGREWGFDAIRVANLFALRGTDPRCLEPNYADAIGPENDAHLRREAEKADKIVVAWGARETMGRDNAVLRLLSCYGDVYAFEGEKGKSYPPHPLYLKATRSLVLYRRKKVEAAP
jgi:hypothetical protein